MIDCRVDLKLNVLIKSNTVDFKSPPDCQLQLYSVHNLISPHMIFNRKTEKKFIRKTEKNRKNLCLKK